MRAVQSVGYCVFVVDNVNIHVINVNEFTILNIHNFSMYSV